MMNDHFQNRSEASQEILSRKPTFVEKWALLLFLVILFFLVCGTAFIKYPDTIQTRATLTADNSPKEIMPLQSGRLIKLFVQNGQPVDQGEMLGWIESTSDPVEVIKLSSYVDSSVRLLSQGESGKVTELFIGPFQNLGDLQSAYQVFQTGLQQFNDYWVNGFYTRRKNLLISDLNSIDKLNDALQTQKNLTEKDSGLSVQTFKMNDQLYKEKVISAEEYRQAQSKLYSKESAIPQINSNILANQTDKRNKFKELDQLDHDASQQKIIFEQALQTLKSRVDQWKRDYILTAPISGTVEFNYPLQQNKFIEQGKLLGYVNPPDSKFYTEMYLPQGNLGKVDTGMQVQLRFDAYPYQEVGFIRGKLEYISKVASDSGYLAIVSLDNGLRTNYDKTIQFKSGLRADALIITKNMRLLQRLYFSVIKQTSVRK